MNTATSNPYPNHIQPLNDGTFLAWDETQAHIVGCYKSQTDASDALAAYSATLHASTEEQYLLALEALGTIEHLPIPHPYNQEHEQCCVIDAMTDLS